MFSNIFSKKETTKSNNKKEELSEKIVKVLEKHNSLKGVISTDKGVIFQTNVRTQFWVEVIIESDNVKEIYIEYKEKGEYVELPKEIDKNNLEHLVGFICVESLNYISKSQDTNSSLEKVLEEIRDKSLSNTV